MIKFVSDLRQVGGFLRVLHQKTDRHDATEIKPTNQLHLRILTRRLISKTC